MRITIESLRRWFLVLGAIVVVAIAGTFFYARYQVRKVARDLPGKLGIDIQRTAKEFTFSKSEHGRTLFTLRASRAVEYKGGGRVLLHDFAILLYAKDGRADRIAGSQFEFDPNLRLATADGEVHLDLHSPQAGTANTQAGGVTAAGDDPETVHVVMHGLVFDQTSGDASTPGAIEFRFRDTAGKAQGATYDSAAGLLELLSDVDVTSKTSSRDFRIRAAHAGYQRDLRQLDLTTARFDNGTEKAAAEHAVTLLDDKGKPQSIHATGGVELQTAEHAKLMALVADGDFDSEGKLRQVRLSGGVRGNQDQRGRNTQAQARDAVMTFGGNNSLERAVLSGAVAIHDVQGETVRDLKAEHVDAKFVAAGAHRSEAQDVTAQGGAAMRVVQMAQNGRGEDSTLSADTLIATLAGGNRISHLQGTGNARVRRVSAGGRTQTSSSDNLAVDFVPSVSPRPQGQIASAVQRGNVVITQTAPASKGSATPAVSTAHAAMAEYSGGTEMVTLTGKDSVLPRLNDGSLDLSAQRIVLARLTGDIVATGLLKATYLPGAKEAPLHIVAERGELYRDQQRAVFLGHARLWQQESSIEAPVLELARASGKLIAHGDVASSAPAVHGVFLSKDAPVRVSSQRLTYSDADRVANFDGGTLVESVDARIRADQTVVTLLDRAVAVARGNAPRPQVPTGSSLFPGMSGSVERVVATGHIVLQQPGRRGTGSKLVYTASDGRFVLTGTPAEPPQLTDAVRGTITGNSLIFLSRDDSVQVGEDASGMTTTHTRVRK